jgi:SSS family solute:Na+ symporter
VLAAKSKEQARRGTLFAGYLKLLPLFIFVVPGVVAHALAQSGKLQLSASDQALPALVAALLPAGLRGLVVAGLLAALMSSLSSVFNSTSTLVTLDVYKRLRPDASDSQLVRVGQVSTALLVGCGLLWIPLMERVSGQLYQYMQSVQAYISPPIAAVFLFGILWRRVNARGAMAALWTGFVIGIGRLVAEINKEGLSGALRGFAEINFLHFAVLLFVICSTVLALVSLASAPPPAAQVAGLTLADRAPATPEERQPMRIDLALSAGLIACVLGLWLFFS